MTHKLPSGAPIPTFSDTGASPVVSEEAIAAVARSLLGHHRPITTGTTNPLVNPLDALHHPGPLEGWVHGKPGTVASVINVIREVPPEQRAERAKKVLDVMCGRVPDALTEHFRLHYDPRLDKGDQTTARGIIEVVAWANGPLVLERPNGSGFHKLVEAATASKLIIGNNLQDEPRPIGPNVLGVFVVEHDWSAALKADAEGEVRWPYDTWAVEARISGKRVIALVSRDAFDPDYMLPFVETTFGWVLPTSYDIRGGQWVEVQAYTKATYLGFERVAKIMQEQLRAICIALDAEVIETEVIRAPHKLNHARAKQGKLPIREHHILKLASRHRALPGPPAMGEKRRSPRLHFRRGHWRHYENAKVWINWQLVGDESLGWIDKEYRL